MSNNQTSLRIITVFLVLICASPTLGWGGDGHKIVGKIAHFCTSQLSGKIPHNASDRAVGPRALSNILKQLLVWPRTASRIYTHTPNRRTFRVGVLSRRTERIVIYCRIGLYVSSTKNRNMVVIRGTRLALPTRV